MNIRKKIIALVAHDNEKQKMIEFVIHNEKILKDFELVGTAGTVKAINNVTKLNVKALGHGPEGGDIIIAYEILNKRIDKLIFFVDARQPHGHEHDINALIRTAVIGNIPFALNRKTAEFLIKSELMK
jgi:methylglyoxal synthase